MAGSSLFLLAQRRPFSIAKQKADNKATGSLVISFRLPFLFHLSLFPHRKVTSMLLFKKCFLMVLMASAVRAQDVRRKARRKQKLCRKWWSCGSPCSLFVLTRCSCPLSLTRFLKCPELHLQVSLQHRTYLSLLPSHSTMPSRLTRRR